MLVRNVVRSLLFAVCYSTACYAQPNVEVYWNLGNRPDTIMDFGVTLQGFPVTIPFYIENKSAVTVSVFEPGADTEPYFQIINVPEVEPQHPRKEEFEALDKVPYHIPSGKTMAFQITFKAVIGNAQLPPDVANESLLMLRIVDSTTPRGTSFDKTLRLRALKTLKVIASNTPWVGFDSVYVNPKPLAPELFYTVENVTTQVVKVDEQNLTMRTPVVGLPEISVQIYPSAEFSGKGSIPWTTRYTPHNKGRDSATFTLVYKPNQNAAKDSLSCAISGIGVQQQIVIVSGTGSPEPVEVRGDTIDFGSVTAGKKYSARVIVRNQGNVNIGYDAETKVGVNKDTLAYQIVRSFSVGGNALRTNDFDTLDVEFYPIEGGYYLIEYRLETDLLRRDIRGVPDGANVSTIVMKAFSKRPQIQLSPSQIDFGTLVLYPTCTSISDRTLTVRNIGNADLVIDSITIDPPNPSILLNTATFIVPLGSSNDIVVRLTAETLGNINSNIVLHTNSLNTALPTPCIGRIVAPDTITVRIPLLSTARPGTDVQIPVTVSGSSVSKTSAATIVVTFDPSLLRYRSLNVSGYGAEGASVLTELESPRGVLTLSLNANGNFKPIDTLLVFSFYTFLGKQAQTPVSISNETTRFGNAGCSNVLDVSAESGVFAIDSICGLEYKTMPSNGKAGVHATQTSLFPNPASETVNLVAVLRQPQLADLATEICIADSYGRICKRLSIGELTVGMNVIPIDVSDLERGLYVCELRRGILGVSSVLVISR